MGIEEIKDSDGKVIGTAIVCRRNTRDCCHVCGRPSDILCDFPVTRKGTEITCDAKCCRSHSANVGPDRDFCLPHQRFMENRARQEAK